MTGEVNSALDRDENILMPSGNTENKEVDLLNTLDIKDVETIKTLPCTMKEKRKIRKYLHQKGMDSTQPGKKKTKKKPLSQVRKFNDSSLEFLYGIRLWEKSIYEIEGRFGSAVRSYFAFLRFLFYVNLLVFLIVFSFIVVPSIVQTEFGFQQNTNETDCEYNPYDPNEINSFVQYIIWWFTGQGFMEKTYLFMGFYKNSDQIQVSEDDYVNYSIPLAYVFIAFFYFFVSLIALVSRASRGLRESVVTDENRFYSYCNKVFAGWDYCIVDGGAALIKHQSLLNEMRADIADEKLRESQANRSTRQKVKLYLKRFFINIICLLVLAGSFTAIFFTADFAVNNTGKFKDDSYILDLIVTYLVTIVITVINFIAPLVFNFLIKQEEYSPVFTIKFTLIRTVSLRLASIIFLYVAIYLQVNCKPNEQENQGEVCAYCPGVQCWETYIGQEMYKLTILDFFIGVSITLFVEFPRKLIVTHCACSLSDKIGVQEFNLPAKVLDIVYAQTICWIGAFYCPLLPGIVLVKFFIFFYLQKVSLMHNCQPSKNPFRSSRTGTFFFYILLVGFMVAIVPVIVGVSVLKPSAACGPFRGEEKMFDTITQLILQAPVPVQNAFWFIGSAPFILIVALILFIVIYYFRALDAAYKNMIKVLRDQLILEGKDKQFLLKRAILLNEHLVKNGLNIADLNLEDETRKFYMGALNSESTVESGRSSKTDVVEMREFRKTKVDNLPSVDSTDYFHKNHYYDEHKFD